MILSMSDYKQTKKCSVAGCDGALHLRGLCIKHYGRLMRTGTTDHYRDARGLKVQHPFWMRFNQLSRRGELCPEWMEFWAFVDGISPKPEDAKKMYRPDTSKPYGPDNFAWRKTPTRDDTLAYYKTWNRANPDARWSKHLADKFGMTPADYWQKFDAQKGVCAICGKPENASHKAREGGEKRRMAVDHCHGTNKVRDLLCTNCNTMLGAADDNPARLFAAIQYLAKWGKVAKVS